MPPGMLPHLSSNLFRYHSFHYHSFHYHSFRYHPFHYHPFHQSLRVRGSMNVPVSRTATFTVGAIA